MTQPPLITTTTVAEILLPFVLAGVYAAVVWQRIRTARKVAAKIVEVSKPYQLGDALREKRILVFGDSTAVGVGCAPALTVPGRLADYLHANVENYAVSGAVTRDMADQMAKAFRGHYDLVLMQIGANDVLGGKSLDSAASALNDLLGFVLTKTERVVLLTAGDIGKAPLFWWPLNWLVSYRTRALRKRFMAVCAKRGVQYVDIYAEPDVFHLDRKKYYTPDGLHLTADGYEFWFELLKPSLDIWPELKRSVATSS